MVAKRVALVVVLALIGAGCHWLDPRPGLGPNLTVHVGPPGALGVRAIDVSAADVADGTAAVTTVRLDGKHGALIATGTTLPLHFTFDVGQAGPGVHVFYVRSKVGDLERRGLGVVTGGIRLNQLQALGTHNSYHTYPAPPLDGVESLDYFEDPLDVQLQDQGIRQFELDVNIGNDATGQFQVFHVQGLDTGTTCFVFTDCLTTIKTWSQAHPQHMPIAIQLELKDNDFNLPAPNRNWISSDLARLDATIRSVFTEDQVYTPDDLRGAHATLPEAIAQDGWPEINAVRGKVMFLMDNGGTFRSWYRTGAPALEGRVIFSNADPGDADAAFIKRNDPIGSFADIQSLIAQGYVVRTRSDADTVQARANDTTMRDAAIASGSTWVSSDFVVPGRSFGNSYYVSIPGGTPARCNPINAPSWCTSDLIEALSAP
jgi:hypothetical protein